jgi:tetratricopeptide (TPR) repeat protein
MLDPRSSATLTGLGAVYQALGAHEMAARTLEQARALSPQDSTVLTTLGEIYREEREYELALEAFRQAVALDKDSARAATGLGRMYSSMGQNAEAAEVFEGLVKRGKASLEVLSALASLPRALVSVDLPSEIGKLAPGRGDDPAEFDNAVAFLRVAVLDRADRHAEAWQQALAANRVKHEATREDLRHARDREAVVLAWLRGHAIRPVDDGRYPVSLFILGPSRSGKTTMEQLVGTLAGVKRGYENPSVEMALRRAFQTAGLLSSDYFELLPEQLHSLYRDLYLGELARRAPSAKVFTNTAPRHVEGAGLFAGIFPNVRFIGVKRNVEDVILRMFQSRYNAGNFYSYDLKAARDYVLRYHQLMDLLAEKLPAMVRIIRYEDMVADPAAALRVAVDLCGLPVPTAPPPAVGNDRGCAEPYRQFMAAELAG